MFRRCRACKIEKKATLDNFYRQPNGLFGLATLCKECSKKRAIQWGKANAVRLNERTRRRNKKDPAQRMLNMASRRAKEIGVPFDLKKSDIFVPTHCPLLGIPLEVQEGKCGRNSPSLDRKVPSLGYVRGNIWVISHKANSIKNDATLQELQTFVRNLEIALCPQ